MQILLADNAGFCFGVKRALDIAYNAAEGKNKVFTLGPLIHNELVIEQLKGIGINQIDDINDLPLNSSLIIRTHGVTKDIYKKIAKSNIAYIDATCPFVKKIHKIVDEYYTKGYKIIIVGDKDHPEVMGINSICNYDAVIVQNFHQFENLGGLDNTCLVAQTTFSKDEWDKIKTFASDTCKGVVVFDTICNATYQRQTQAEEIAQQVDAMIVIGARHSSNTKQLFEKCKKICKDTFLVETASQLPKSVFDKCIVGITAGASTPQWIIKEVISIMSEEKTTQELSFAEQVDQSLIDLKTGDIVKGTVIGITPTEIYVDIGFKADGVIPVDQFTDVPNPDLDQLVKIGDEIEAFVYRVSDVEGTVGLSVKKLKTIAGRKKLEEAANTKEVLTGKVVETVNGGIIVLYSGARVFIPASLASLRYVQDLNTLVGQEVSFRIIENNQRRRKIIGSIKAVLAEENTKKKAEFWENAEEGKEYKGVVKSLTDFGAFVDIGGIDGLVHISELSWSRIKHPSEVINVGDEISVFIISLDKEKNKVSLGYKRKMDDPWLKAQEMYNIGDVVQAKIVRIVAFGAFAQLLPTVDGLIHISQISTERIAKPSSVLSVGQEVTAKITNIDWENKKISLSIRALLEPEEAAEQSEQPE
ncbi:MAG: bifunctional 4-hydroxy-3-methylbut-2-enyl diphosphate reductase/30S ribosomal protein S1 [Clostridiaceae bacterium]|nr:bifunctional 4-hydroxy-3-methylbut-2-enyl diphosphate reductase/30S ribosomal protein S1 [Clostridiaceae bacterium]